jgi:hypothetical protein
MAIKKKPQMKRNRRKTGRLKAKLRRRAEIRRRRPNK